MAHEDNAFPNEENRMNEPVYSEPVSSILLRAREARAMTIDDVDRVTHISPGWVSVMERGDWSQYPSMVYARGHVKVYAEFLGLDVPATLRQFQLDWSQVVPSELPENNGKTTSMKPIGQSSGDTRLYWLAAAIVAVLLLGGLAVKSERKSPAPKTPVLSSTPPPTAVVPPPAPASVPPVNSSTTPSPSPSTPVSVGQSPSPSSTLSAPAPSVPLTPSPTEGGASPSNRLTLKMVGLKNVWVVISVDDGTVRRFHLSPGDERTLVGRNFMTFSTQSGDGLALFLNGKRLGLAGPTSAPVLHRRLNRQTLHHLKVVVAAHSSSSATNLKSSSTSLGQTKGGAVAPASKTPSQPVSEIPLAPSTPNASSTSSGGSH